MNFAEIVYNIVKKIPRGGMRTYKRVAVMAGNPGAYRAVGTILSKNTDRSIPCHRVIRSDGKIGGYNGLQGEKARLLAEEGSLSHLSNDR